MDITMDDPRNSFTGNQFGQALLLKTTSDIKDCVVSLKAEYEQCGNLPLTDDCQILHRFCAKLELLLQQGMKSKTTLLGAKKDYWNFFYDCLSSNKNLNDGVRFVKAISELKTNIGRGRAFIRFALVHQRLADTLQHCLMCSKINNDWYMPQSLFNEKRIAEDLIGVLYDLNDIQFDLAPRGHDLDASWPSFAKRSQGTPYNWRPPSRADSIASLSSIQTLEIYPNLSTSPRPGIQEDESVDGGSELAEFREKNSQLTQQLEDVNEKIFDIHEKYLQAREGCVRLERNLLEHETTIARLQSEAETRTKQFEEQLGQLNATIEELSSSNKCQKDADVQTIVADPHDSLTSSASQTDQLLEETSPIVQESSPTPVISSSSMVNVSSQMPETEIVLVQSEAQTSQASTMESDVQTDIIESKTVHEKFAGTETPDLVESSTQCENSRAENDGIVSESNEHQQSYENEQPTSDVCKDEEIAQLRLQLGNAISKKVEALKRVEEDAKQREETDLRVADLEAELEARSRQFEAEVKGLTSELETVRIELNRVELQKNEEAFIEKAYDEIVKEKSGLEEELKKVWSTNCSLQWSVSEVATLSQKLKVAEEDLVKLEDEIRQKDSLILELKQTGLTSAEDGERELPCGNCDDDDEPCNNDAATHSNQTGSTQKADDEKSATEACVDDIDETKENNVKNDEQQDTACVLEIDNVDRTKVDGLEHDHLQSTASVPKPAETDQEDKDHLISQLTQDLSVMKESVLRREQSWKNERESLDRELISLRLEMRNKSMTYESKIKKLNSDSAVKALQERVSELEQKIAATEMEHEEEAQKGSSKVNEILAQVASLEKELSVSRSHLQQVQKERDVSVDTNIRLVEAENQLQEDVKELKKKLIKLLRDKDSLWQKSDQLEYEQRQRRSYHWVDSSTVEKCYHCNEEFTVTTRKHHCRECGRVFCHSCCSTWVLTAHSSRKERVCYNCLANMSQVETTSAGNSECSSDSEILDSIVSRSRLTICSAGDDDDDDDDNDSVMQSGKFSTQEDAPDLESSTAAEHTAAASETVDGDEPQATSSGMWSITQNTKMALSWVGSMLPMGGRSGPEVTPAAADVSITSTTTRSSDTEDESRQPPNQITKSDESFDFITPTEVFESRNDILPDPKVMCASIVCSSDFEDVDSVTGPAELWIKPGLSYALPVAVDSLDVVLVWEFSTAPKGITFSLMYKDSDTVPYLQCDVLVEPCRVDSHKKPVSGELDPLKTGIYTFFFDNVASRFTSKKLSYSLRLRRKESV